VLLEVSEVCGELNTLFYGVLYYLGLYYIVRNIEMKDMVDTLVQQYSENEVE